MDKKQGKTVVTEINFKSEPWRLEEFMEHIEAAAPEKFTTRDGFDPVHFWTVGSSLYVKLKTLQKIGIPDSICRFIVKTHKIANDAKNIAVNTKTADYVEKIQKLENLVQIYEKESEEIMDENIELKNKIAELEEKLSKNTQSTDFIDNLKSVTKRTEQISRIKERVKKLNIA